MYFESSHAQAVDSCCDIVRVTLGSRLRPQLHVGALDHQTKGELRRHSALATLPGLTQFSERFKAGAPKAPHPTPSPVGKHEGRSKGFPLETGFLPRKFRAATFTEPRRLSK